jgi:hypothetical protein
MTDPVPFAHPSQLALPEDIAELAPAQRRVGRPRRADAETRAAAHTRIAAEAATPELPQRRSRRAPKRDRGAESDSTGYSGGRSADVRALSTCFLL